GIPTVDQILMNSPAQPLAYAVGTLTDPRKDTLADLLNLGTGVRVSDVDMKKQRNAAMEMLRDMLTADPHKVAKYDSISVRPEALGTLTPEEIDQLRLLKSLEKQAADQAKKEKARPAAR